MSQVVIGDILPYTQAQAILNQTVFGTNWTANAASDVVVYVTPPGDEPNDVTQMLAYPAGYSVAFIGSQQDVQVTLVTPSVAGAIVTITRQTPADRMNLYTNTNFTPSMLNNDFGILTLVDQQAQLVDQKVGPRYNYSAIIVDVVDTILPILAANEAWVKNPSNTGFIPYELPSSGIAPADATYVTITDETADLPNSVNFDGLSAGIVAFTGSGFVSNPIDGTTNQINIANATGVAGSVTISIADNVVLPGTAGMGIPAGTTAQRVTPTPPSIGFRYNSTLDSLEFYSNGAWTLVNDDTDGTILPGLVNELAFYSANGTTLSGLTTANDGVLITSAAGVPSISSTLPSAVQNNITLLGTLAEALNMGTHLINNVVDPVSPQDAATKNYIDSIIAEFASVFVARLASTTALTVTYANGASGVGATLTNADVQAALTLDGVAAVVNDLVLIKNQASALQNGYYVVTNIGSGATNWVLTRSTKYDLPAEIQPGDLFVITAGNTLINTTWIQTATVTAVGVDSINFSQYSVALPIPVTQGGTGTTSFTAYGVITGGTTATSLLQSVTPGAAGTMFQSGGASALPTWSTTTYPATNAINTLLYASAANVMSELATANSGVLVTSATGVPSISNGGQIPGTATNNNASAGNIGEYISASVASGSAVAVVSATYKTITSISLTAGDWDVDTFVGTVVAAGTIISAIAVGASLTDNVQATELSNTIIYNPLIANNVPAFGGCTTRFSLASTTTIYLVAAVVFTVSTASAFGQIKARRVR